MSSGADPALETLFFPFVTGVLEWPEEGALFLRARDGAPLHQRRWPNLIFEQTFKPEADALHRAGFEPFRIERPEPRNLVLLLPPRQRDEARTLMAKAVVRAGRSGRVVAAAANNEGARSAEADLAVLVNNVRTLSKNKCRVFWGDTDQVNERFLEEWQRLDTPRPIEDGYVSRPGIFAWDRIDIASQLLASHLPADLHGVAADLGAGFGYLSAELLSRAPGIKRLDVYEGEQRALDLARMNLIRFEDRVTLNYCWHDIASGLSDSYDVIVTNPPFHAQTGRDRPDIGRRFIRVAADALRSGGVLWLVANRHLPYEEVLDRSFGSVRIVDQKVGFKIIEARKS